MMREAGIRTPRWRRKIFVPISTSRARARIRVITIRQRLQSRYFVKVPHTAELQIGAALIDGSARYPISRSKVFCDSCPNPAPAHAHEMHEAFRPYTVIIQSISCPPPGESFAQDKLIARVRRSMSLPSAAARSPCPAICLLHRFIIFCVASLKASSTHWRLSVHLAAKLVGNSISQVSIAAATVHDSALRRYREFVPVRTSASCRDTASKHFADL